MKPNTFFKVNSIEEIEKLHADPNINTIFSLNSDISSFKKGFINFVSDYSNRSYIPNLPTKEIIYYDTTEVENPFTKQPPRCYAEQDLELSKVWANCKLTDPYLQFEYNLKKQKDMKNLEQLKAEHKAMGETIAKLEKENQHDWSKPQFYKSIYNDTVIYSTGKHSGNYFEGLCINTPSITLTHKGDISNNWLKESFKPHKVDLNL